MQVYRIAGWDKHFENNRTRELKVLSWVPVPNKQDGDGYTELLSHKDGAAHFGCWHAILQVASKCDPRGTLVRDGQNGTKTPHDIASLSRITRISEKVLKSAIERLIIIGWLEIYDNPAGGCDADSTSGAPSCASRARVPEGNGMEGNGMEWKGGVGGEPPPPPVGILELIDQIRSCNPNFKGLNQILLENELKAVPIKDAQSAVKDFCRDMAGALKLPDMPIKKLSNYLRKAFDGPGTQHQYKPRLS